MKHTHLLLYATALMFLLGCGGNDQPKNPAQSDLIMGMDLSFQPEIQTVGYTYKDANDNPIDLLPYLSNNGVDIVRLRLWHTPSEGHSGLEEMLAYAVEVKAAGMDILLDLHYSDTWADPGNQTMPTAWVGLSHEQLKSDVYAYTHAVMQAFADQNTLPTIVQIGNETNQGFLWNSGRIGGNFENNWNNFRELIAEGISAVRSVDSSIQIMLHYAGIDGVNWFLSGVDELDYDIIGLSYYSIWHEGNIPAVGQNLNMIIDLYDRPIMIVETAYPFTLGWNDWTNNNWGETDQLLSGYPATPEGQRKYLADLKTMMADLPDGKGLGICWWAPDWVAYRGDEATNGSSWENAAIFDFTGKALPVVEEFD